MSNAPQITFNTALYLGGGIYTGGIFKTLTSDGLKVANNNAGNGGGIYGQTGSDISLVGVSPGGQSISISNNRSSENGGGIYINTGSHLYLHNAFVTANSADGAGGGMLLKGSYTPGGFVQFIGNLPDSIVSQ